MDEAYVPIWQTWTLLRRTGPPSLPTPPREPEWMSSDKAPRDAAPQAHDAQLRCQQNVREKVQIARIERRMSVAQLAQATRCDVETLAAFERGDEVLSAQVVDALRRELQLD